MPCVSNYFRWIARCGTQNGRCWCSDARFNQLFADDSKASAANGDADSDGRVYTFPNFSLAAGATVQVWTKAGVNNASNLYWGDALSIWTNTGDTAFLRNGGTLVDSCSYGGGGVQASC